MKLGAEVDGQRRASKIPASSIGSETLNDVIIQSPYEEGNLCPL